MRCMSQINRSCWQFMEKVIALSLLFVFIFVSTSGLIFIIAHANGDCFCHVCVQIRNARALLERVGQAALAVSAVSFIAWVKLDLFKSGSSTLVGVKTRLNN